MVAGLKLLNHKQLKTGDMSYSITINNAVVPIAIRKHATSRRIVLRYQQRNHCIALTLPRYVSIRQGLSFVEAKREWIAARLQEIPASIAFVHGQTLPVLGERFEIRHVGGRGVVQCDGTFLLVPGQEGFMSRRVRDFLKDTARRYIAQSATEKAALLGKRITKITLRDTHSHWGSCNHKGNLSFSWRLVFAPVEVLDYVICHEVAHLRYLNHSNDFWLTVEMLCPRYRELRQWLRQHANELQRYGG